MSKHERRGSSAAGKRLLIVGCGMATARLLEALVERRHPYRIEVVGEEPSVAYNRVLLSALLAGDKQEADLQLLAPSWYQRHQITLSMGEAVTAVDLAAHTALTSRGRVIHWDLLVFATGASASLPRIPGLPAERLLAFRDQRDLAALRQLADSANQAVVLGGGLLGLEAAYGLNRLGVKVTVVHRQDSLLNRQLDGDAGELLQATLEAQGLAFRLGVRTEHWDAATETLHLSDGSSLACPALLAATGITPNCEVARAADLECGHGIRVDAAMTTSHPDVFALGECCQHGERTYGMVAPVNAQAEVLAAQLCGDVAARYEYRDSAVHLKVAGCNLVSSGVLEGEATEHQVLSDPSSGVYRKLVFRAGRLCGFVLVGSQQHAAWYQELMDTDAELGALRPWMMFGPPPVSGAGSLQEVRYANN